MLAGAIRVGTPFLFVSLGECLTEKSGRINLGLEGTLVLGAMVGYAASYQTGSPWLGVLAAGIAGTLFGMLHGWICKFPRVNDVAIGIAMMLLGMGLAFYFGKPFIQPSAPMLPSIPLGFWSDIPQIRSALNINALFLVGVAIAFAHVVGVRQHPDRPGRPHDRRLRRCRPRHGLLGRHHPPRSPPPSAASSPASAAPTSRSTTPAAGTSGISSGQGLMAVALVIFARWNPLYCLLAALLFGGAGALGPALQAVGVTEGYYLFYAAPYVLTLVIMILTSSARGQLKGAPAELSITR